MRRIAVVEDNADNRLLVEAILDGRYALAEYVSGPAALAGLLAEPPDLVLLDISLPEMDGTEVLRRIRLDSRLQRLPVIALTAHAMTGDRERIELARRPVDLAALVDDVVQQLGDHFLKPAVRLERQVPAGLAAVETDPTRLKQVLFNLVGNALKFTHEGSVTIRVASDPDTGRPLTIAVSDTGIGIPPDRHEAIFEAFQQADNTTERRYGGTGLGLAISRSLLHAMGHRLTLESVMGQGSTFTVHLDPSAADPGANAPARPDRSRDGGIFGGRRILVIDDESDSRIG